MTGRDRFPPPEEDRPRPAPRPARPVTGPRPPGSLGAPAHPQHRGRRRRPRGGRSRDRSPAHLVHRRPRLHPRPRRRRHALPALRAPPRHRGRPAQRPVQRDHRPASSPARTPAHIRQNRSRTPHPAHRGRAVGCYLSGRHHRGRLLRSFSPCSRRRASRSAMHRDGCWRAGCSSDMCAAMPTSPPRASSPAQLTAALHMRGLVDGLDHLETSGSSPAWPSSEWPTGPVP